MDILIKSLSEAGLGLGSLALIAYLFIVQTKRQDKKDQAYIETLSAIQKSMIEMQVEAKAKWELMQSMSVIVKSSAEALSQIKCLNK